MAETYDSMMSPELEGLIDMMGSKFALCTLSSARARQINAYFGQLGGGAGNMVPPQVDSVARKPLSIAFEEIAAEKIVLADAKVKKKVKKAKKAEEQKEASEES